MSEVKWIKLSVNLPDNKKIKRIRKYPDGDNVILFWVFLLARAGESNAKGGLFFTENIPYKEEDLAADFDFTVEFVNFALKALEKFNMIERYEGVIFIRNWDEYQQLDKLEKMQEQNRERQKRYKKKQQEVVEGNVTVTLPNTLLVTQGNATDIDIDKDIDIKDTPSHSKTSVKNAYSDEFEKFWSEYPRKVDKKQAFTKFKTALKRYSFDVILQGTQQYKKLCEKRKVETKYIKHAATFLHNDSFLNDFNEKTDNKKPNTSQPISIQEKEIAFQNWVESGKDPKEFDWS